jgi:hypothetical protein
MFKILPYYIKYQNLYLFGCLVPTRRWRFELGLENSKMVARGRKQKASLL